MILEIFLAAVLAGPGPSEEVELSEMPSLHMIQHVEHSGIPNLRVTGLDGGRTLNGTVFGFLPYWGGDTWLRYDLISVLACFCVDMDSTGTITGYNGFPVVFLDAIDGISSTGGIPVVTVANFSSSSIHALLTNHSTAAIATIVDLVDQYPVDGVSIDFENVSGGDRDQLTSFMEELRYQLDLNVPGSHLSICTPAVDWSGAFDYDQLAQCTDALFMMCYPFHGSWSSEAGPCCPLTGWGASPEASSNMVWCLGDYAKYAPGQQEKVVVGLPYYGFQWETEDGNPHSRVTGSCSALTYSVMAGNAATYGRLWDQESLTPWYAYINGGWNQGWYDDEESLGLKYDLLRSSNFQGAGIWALGYDGSRTELWDLLEDSFCGPAWVDSLTDNLESRFTVHGPLEYWRNVTEGGLFYGYFYTYSISQGPDVNWCKWTFELPDSSQSYMLDAWLPQGGTAEASYRIVRGGSVDTVLIDQSMFGDQWVSLGGPWSAEDGLEVLLGDCTGQTGDKIVADCIRFRSPTGIAQQPEESSEASLILSSPNPSRSFVLTLPNLGNCGEIDVMDISGRCVETIRCSHPDQERITWPSGRSYPAGIYTFLYHDDSSTSSIRVVLLQ